jgi:hypothetical protein
MGSPAVDAFSAMPAHSVGQDQAPGASRDLDPMTVDDTDGRVLGVSAKDGTRGRFGHFDNGCSFSYVHWS